jgi:hypothetical protein
MFGLVARVYGERGMGNGEWGTGNGQVGGMEGFDGLTSMVV